MFVEYLNCFGCFSVSLFVNISASLSTPFSLSLSRYPVVVMFHKETVHGQEPVRPRSMRMQTGCLENCIFRRL